MPDNDATALLCSAIDSAKKSLAPHTKLDNWKWVKQKHRNDNEKQKPLVIVELLCSSIVAVNGHQFQDNVDRIPGSSFDQDAYGDSLPQIPTILTGLLEDWPAYQNKSSSSSFWSLEELARRAPLANHRVSLDGGPGFARMSMNTGYVTLQEYQHYCKNENEADTDLAPLYVFDHKILQLDCLRNEIGITTPTTTANKSPLCFSHDMMSCIEGSEYRPLPPAWLLIGAARSGTPIHDHPLTIAWNALFEGCKLWCCLPPDVDETTLLLNLQQEDDDDDSEKKKRSTNDTTNTTDNTTRPTTDDDEDDADAFDLAAIDWFDQIGNMLPDNAKIIVQHPGEVVYVPAGWFHVVLNVTTSTAISSSLTLRRDLSAICLPFLKKYDPAFATFWINRLAHKKYHA